MNLLHLLLEEWALSRRFLGLLGQTAVTLKADLSVHLSPPPMIPEASQTRMFYTAYEMFEGHRKRKWAWFPVSSWTLQQLLPLPLCLTHASTNLCTGRPGQPAGSPVATGSVPLVPLAPSLQENVHVHPSEEADTLLKIRVGTSGCGWR